MTAVAVVPQHIAHIYAKLKEKTNAVWGKTVLHSNDFTSKTLAMLVTHLKNPELQVFFFILRGLCPDSDSGGQMFQHGVQTRVGTEFRVLLKSNKDSSPLGFLVCFYNTVFPLLLDSGV